MRKMRLCGGVEQRLHRFSKLRFWVQAGELRSYLDFLNVAYYNN